MLGEANEHVRDAIYDENEGKHVMRRKKGKATRWNYSDAKPDIGSQGSLSSCINSRLCGFPLVFV